MEIALHALRRGRWYVGIGVGEVDLPLPASPREGSGPAFVAARAAVDRAKAAAAHVPIAVAGGVGRKVATAPARRNGGAATGSDGLDRLDGLDGLDRLDKALACANAEAVLRLIGRLVLDRTPAQWKVVDMLRSVRHGQPGTHGTQKIAAQNLGITEQSVSRAVLRSGWQEEWAARPAAEMLLALADSLIAGHGRRRALLAPAGRGKAPASASPGPHHRRRHVNALWITLALLTAGFVGWPVTSLVFRLARTIDDRTLDGQSTGGNANVPGLNAGAAEDPSADSTADPEIPAAADASAGAAAQGTDPCNTRGCNPGPGRRRATQDQAADSWAP